MKVRLSFMGFKDLKTAFIVEVANRLFLQRGIRDVTIKDIANEAGIGEATIYRHFSKKQNIVLASALSLKEKVFKGYFDLSKGVTGFEKLSIFYNSYLTIFRHSPEYFYFINEFDAYMCMEENISLDEYEEEIDSFKSEYLEAYEAGLKDHSVRKIDSIKTFYFATTHSLLELCKKLAVTRALLKQDQNSEKEKEIECLIEIILASIKQNESNSK